jgi:hypothetical protein
MNREKRHFHRENRKKVLRWAPYKSIVYGDYIGKNAGKNRKTGKTGSQAGQ